MRRVINMLDIFKLNFGSKLVKGIVTKAIRKYVKKQFGIDIQLDLNTLDIDYNDGDIIVKTDLEIKVNRNETKKLLTQIDEMI